MNKAILILPLPYYQYDVDEEKRQLLENHGISLVKIATLCVEYFKTMSSYTKGQLVIADPLYIIYVVKEKTSSEFHEYVLNALLNTDPAVRYPLDKLLEVIAMACYVLLLNIERKLTEIINGSGFYIDSINFIVRYCDYQRVEIEVSHEPIRRPKSSNSINYTTPNSHF